jgi:pentatricopeptide repeat protein
MERTFAELCADTQVNVQGTHWASLITAYGISNNDVEKALEVFEVIPTHPSNRGGRPLDEPVVWEAILNVLATKGTVEQMETMRSRMESSGAKPTAYVYNVLISGYSRHSQIEKSREIFESMVNTITGVSAPNNHPQLHTSSGHPKPHSDINQGAVFREPSTYEVMIRAELESGDRERAEEVVRRMEERGYPAAVFFKARSLLENNFVSHGQGRMEGYHHIPTLGLDAQVSV